MDVGAEIIPAASVSSNSERLSSDRPKSSANRPKRFADSDDEMDGGGARSWSKRDMTEYRNKYPYTRSDERVNSNYQFYTNEVESYPDGDLIDNIHKKWFGKYEKLEYHHGYIQWLFPIREKGLNWSADPLQEHEIDKLKKDKRAMERLQTSYRLMSVTKER